MTFHILKLLQDGFTFKTHKNLFLSITQKLSIRNSSPILLRNSFLIIFIVEKDISIEAVAIGNTNTNSMSRYTKLKNLHYKKRGLLPTGKPVFHPSVPLYYRQYSDRKLSVGHFSLVTTTIDGSLSGNFGTDNVSDGHLASRRFVSMRRPFIVGN